MMSDKQKSYIWVAMSKVEFYNNHGQISLFNSVDIKRVKEVRSELGLSNKVCETCLEEVVKFMQETYTIYKK